jgi:hypothetical protein
VKLAPLLTPEPGQSMEVRTGHGVVVWRGHVDPTAVHRRSLIFDLQILPSIDYTNERQ